MREKWRKEGRKEGRKECEHDRHKLYQQVLKEGRRAFGAQVQPLCDMRCLLQEG